jgi:tetratricopeptide (TPR) repeat protein
VHLFAGRYEEAADTFQRVRAVDHDFPFVNSFLGRALTFGGRPGEALPLLNDTPFAAYAYVMTGRRAEAEELFVANQGNPYGEAIIYAALQDMERTLEALERTAVSQPQRVGRLLMTPEMAALRGDPRFAALRKKLNLP